MEHESREVRGGTWRLTRSHTHFENVQRLRMSDKDGLTLKNEAEYASFVESKGLMFYESIYMRRND